LLAASDLPAASPCCVHLYRRSGGIDYFGVLAWLVLDDGRSAASKLKIL